MSWKLCKGEQHGGEGGRAGDRKFWSSCNAENREKKNCEHLYFKLYLTFEAAYNLDSTRFSWWLLPKGVPSCPFPTSVKVIARGLGLRSDAEKMGFLWEESFSFSPVLFPCWVPVFVTFVPRDGSVSSRKDTNASASPLGRCCLPAWGEQGSAVLCSVTQLTEFSENVFTFPLVYTVSFLIRVTSMFLRTKYTNFWSSSVILEKHLLELLAHFFFFLFIEGFWHSEESFYGVEVKARWCWS